MNKILLFLLVAIILSSKMTAQSDSISAKLANITIYDTIVEKLIAMAMENPQIKNAENNSLEAEYEFSRTRTAWMNNVTVAGNLNEFSLNRTINVDPLLRQSTQYPRYNVGVVLPLGLFVNNKKQSKASYHRYLSTLEQVEVQRNVLRRQVKAAYDDYLMYQELISLQQELLQDNKVLYEKARERFEKAETNFTEFSTASRSYNSEKVREVTLRHSLINAEIQLESYIGMKMDVALQLIYTQLQSLPK